MLGLGCRRSEPEKPISGAVAIGVGAIPGRPGYESMVRGLQMAVDRLNGAGKDRFLLRLPERSSSSAVQVAQTLRDDPTVIGVVGHPESGSTIEALPVYADAEHLGRNAVVAISPTASSPRLTGVSPWFFRVAPSDADAARFVAHWVHDSLGSRRAAVVYRNDSYGRDWSSTFAEAFVKSGAEVVSREPYLTGMTEWDAYARLLAVRKPDVVLFPGDAVDALDMLRALRKAHVTVAFVGGDGTEAMRDSAEAAGAHYVSFFRADRVDTDEGRTFVRVYTERFHQAPDMFAAMSFDAALAIGRAVANGARTRMAVRRALERMGTPGMPAVQGVAGAIRFEKNHDASGRSVVVTRIAKVASMR